jgi:hypothetical protein
MHVTFLGIVSACPTSGGHRPAGAAAKTRAAVPRFAIFIPPIDAPNKTLTP